MEQSLTATIANYAAGTDLSAIPEVVRLRARHIIFDEMASAHFGRRSPAGALAASYAATMGGNGPALVLGTGKRLSPPYAALANGTAGHGEEVDGAHVVGGHPGATIVHAALAVAEHQRCTGADLLNAVVLGYDIGTRLVAACGGKFVVRDRHHLNSDLLYALGGAAAAARLLGLGAERQCHAMGLATFQTNALYALYSEKRHISKSLCNGQFAFGGVSAALMSAAGLEGNADILGAEHGLLETWGADNARDVVAAGLGRDFAVMEANFKFINAGYPIHTATEAAMRLVTEHGIEPATITTITVGMPSRAMRVVNNREMHNICVQDMVAASLALGHLRIDAQPFPAVLDDPLFRQLRGRIAVAVDAEIERQNPNGRGAHVTIERAGQTPVSLRIDHPRGHCQRGGVTWDDLAGKWRGVLQGCDVAAAQNVAERMEDIDDIRELTRHFVGPYG